MLLLKPRCLPVSSLTIQLITRLYVDTLALAINLTKYYRGNGQVKILYFCIIFVQKCTKADSCCSTHTVRYELAKQILRPIKQVLSKRRGALLFIGLSA